MLVVLGDIHFSSARPYSVATCEAFLDWFKDWELNNADNALLLLGDLVHSSVNGGLVIEFVERLWRYSRFDEIHIIPGNHDIKRRDGIDQLAYEFLRNHDGVYIYDRATVAHIQKLSVVMLPHYIPGPHELGMIEHYSNAWNYFTDEYDLVVGHFMEESMSFGTSDAVLNLRKLRTRHICLGHVHTRTNPEIYVGSVFPNRTNENDNSRAAVCFDSSGNRSEYPLPVFCEYITVQYPNDLPRTNALVPIYTITNCTNEQIARLRYGDIHIRKLVRGLDIASKSEYSTGNAELTQLDTAKLFQDFLKAQDPPLPRAVAAICSTSLKNTTNLAYGNRDTTEALLQA